MKFFPLILLVPFCAFLGTQANAGSSQEFIFNSDMRKILPLIPAGWELAKAYKEDAFTNLDVKVGVLADSYVSFPWSNQKTAYAFVMEEIPKVQVVGDTKTYQHGARKLVVALESVDGGLQTIMENQRFIPNASDGGALGDSFLKLGLSKTNHLVLEFWGQTEKNWNFTFEFQATGDDFFLVSQTEFTAEIDTKDWEQTNKNFLSGKIEYSSGGYTSKGQERSGMGSSSQVAVLPLQNLKTLSKLTP